VQPGASGILFLCMGRVCNRGRCALLHDVLLFAASTEGHPGVCKPDAYCVWMHKCMGTCVSCAVCACVPPHAVPVLCSKHVSLKL
jgi:hypothetical protein